MSLFETVLPAIGFLLIAACCFALLSYGTIFGAMYMKIPTRKLKKIIELGEITPDKTILDLGAGHGAISFEAAYKGAHVIAVEIDPFKVLLMRLLLKYNNKSVLVPSLHRMYLKTLYVDVIKANLLKVDYAPADIVYCYLSPPLMQKIGLKAHKEMKQGSKIISVEHRINNWTPTYEDPEDKIYVYEIGKSNPQTI
jgi:16S rRNA G966 N2-methylase RsmD